MISAGVCLLADVRNFTIRFPRTLVPAKGTSYYCFNFRLPDDQEYHLIATEAIIDNANVVHHMALSSCVDSGEGTNDFG